MNGNNFRLIGRYSSVVHGRWTYYRPCIALQYTAANGDYKSVIIKYLGGEYRSTHKALAQLPQILREEYAEQYDAAVAGAIRDLGASAVYKVVLWHDRQMRSIYNSRIIYHLGEVHAHPILPELGVGMYVHPNLDAVREYLRAAQARRPDDYAIVRCTSSEPQVVNGHYLVAALRPEEIVEVVPFSTRKATRVDLAANCRLHQWDVSKRCWVAAGYVPYRDIEPCILCNIRQGRCITYYLVPDAPDKEGGE